MAAAKKKREDAQSMAAKQREIAVSEFFAKNRHLLGFDNPTKALLTTVREAVDNALDEIQTDMGDPTTDYNWGPLVGRTWRAGVRVYLDR